MHRFCSTFVATLMLSSAALAKPDCQEISPFEGLIFDAAAAFSETGNMEAHLDLAISQGVQKVVLFGPHQQSAEYADFFPDLVVLGADPWSGAAPVEFLGLGQYRFAQKLAANPQGRFILSGLSDLSLSTLKDLANRHDNLWFGLSDNDIRSLLKSCASGALRSFLDEVGERVVFTSVGRTMDWKNYKWTIRRLKQLAGILPKDLADRIMFRNGETLYGMAVNAP